MASRWSSEAVVAEHPNLQATAMGLFNSGKMALLVGKKCTAVVDLRNPRLVKKRAQKCSKWEVSCLECSPGPQITEKAAVTYNDKIEILDCGEDIASLHCKRAHARIITDVSWNRVDNDVVATSSIDANINIWDIRNMEKPADSFGAMVGASQISWNRLNENVLASSHESEIKIWDRRKTSSPIHYIPAHLKKILSLDWSYTTENHLVTSGQDCSVKFFNTESPKKPFKELNTAVPIWKARYTPFGAGLVTIIVPQIRRTNDNSLFLWSVENLTSPLHSFYGHKDIIYRFEWRKSDEETGEFELVTWSKDQTLRLWKLDSFIQYLCGNEPSDDSENDIESEKDFVSPSLNEDLQEGELETSEKSNTQNIPKVFLECEEGSIAYELDTTLQQEFSLLNIHLGQVHIEELDPVHRICTVSSQIAKNSKIKLSISFPPSYPIKTCPSFVFDNVTNIDVATKTKILKTLKHTAQIHVKKNRNCLEPCLRQLELLLEQINLNESEFKVSKSPTLSIGAREQDYLKMCANFGGFQDSNVPYPRTSGARFCSNNYLVCFGHPPYVRMVENNSDFNMTPRSLSSYEAHLSSLKKQSQAIPTNVSSSYLDDDVQPTSYLVHGSKREFKVKVFKKDIGESTSENEHFSGKKKTPNLKRKPSSNKIPRMTITLYNISTILPFSKQLAKKYVFEQDIHRMCRMNALASQSSGRPDLFQTWSLASLMAKLLVDPKTKRMMPSGDMHWRTNPLGQSMLTSIIDHYINVRDLQTAAMLCCAFGGKVSAEPEQKQCASKEGVERSLLAPKNKFWFLKPGILAGGSPYHTIHASTQTSPHQVLTSSDSDTKLDLMLHDRNRTNRSNSCGEAYDDDSEDGSPNTTISSGNTCKPEFKMNREVYFQSERSEHYEVIKNVYAEILYKWGLLQERAALMKYSTSVPSSHHGVEFITECPNCLILTSGKQCFQCKSLALKCCICNLSVRGLSLCCSSCGHGGHPEHWFQWFKNHEICPTGCQCLCLKEYNSLFDFI